MEEKTPYSVESSTINQRESLKRLTARQHELVSQLSNEMLARGVLIWQFYSTTAAYLTYFEIDLLIITKYSPKSIHDFLTYGILLGLQDLLDNLPVVLVVGVLQQTFEDHRDL